MGADEKHAATYLGGQYTPNTRAVREKFAYTGMRESESYLRAAFERWLEQVRAEAKAEAYKDAERILHEEARWHLDLHQRHKEYRFKHCSERMTEMENCMTVRANQYKEN